MKKDRLKSTSICRLNNSKNSYANTRVNARVYSQLVVNKSFQSAV